MGKVFSVLSALLLAGAVQAQTNCTTLLYTGAPLTSLTVAPNYPYPMGNPIVGTIVLNAVGGIAGAPLPRNGTSEVDALWSYNIEGFGVLGNRFRSSVITFTTVNGVITDWNISLTGQEGFLTGDSDFFTTFVSTSAGDSVSVALIYMQVIENPPAFLGSNTKGGSWACQPVDPLAAQLASAQARVVSLRNQLAAVTSERDEYVALARVLDAELLALEKKK